MMMDMIKEFCAEAFLTHHFLQEVLIPVAMLNGQRGKKGKTFIRYLAFPLPL